MEKPTDKQIGFATSLGIEDPDKFGKQALSELIEMKTGGPKDKPKEAKVYDGEEAFSSRDHKYDKDPTGLAIEIFNTTWDKDAGVTPTEVMDVCIGLVKQTQEAFK